MGTSPDPRLQLISVSRHAPVEKQTHTFLGADGIPASRRSARISSFRFKPYRSLLSTSMYADDRLMYGPLPKIVNECALEPTLSFGTFTRATDAEVVLGLRLRLAKPMRDATTVFPS